MARQSKGNRLKLGEPLCGDLADFCTAHYNAPEIEIVRAALKEFIAVRLEEEPAMRKRYEEARKKRLGAKEPKVVVLSGGK